MSLPSLATFLSDFGPDSGYPAACELMIARLAPSARVVHLSHSIPAGDTRRGAHLLRLLLPYSPVGIHLAVVDPGVGSDRRIVSLACERGDFLVGPDNGLLPAAAAGLGGVRGAWSLSAERVRHLAGLKGSPSRTFHGRDIFAPAVALLLTGQPPDALGSPLEPLSLARIAGDEPLVEPGKLVAPVSEIDPFGNVQLNLAWQDLEKWLTGEMAARSGCSAGALTTQATTEPYRVVTVRVGPQESIVRIVGTYTDLESGELGMLADSWGLAALARRDGRAADALGVSLHDALTLAPAGSERGGAR